MSRAHTPARSALSFALVCAGCTAPGLENFTGNDVPPPEEDTSSGSSATTEVSPTSGAVLTSTDPGSTSSMGPADSGNAASSTDEPLAPPSILEITLVPDPLLASGLIHVTVTTDDADAVSMTVDTGKEELLAATAPGEFTGTIGYYSAQANGLHTALFVPLRQGLPGRDASRDFLVDLPAGGSEIFWEAVDVLGKGYVAAVATLPDGRIAEFGTLTDAPSRCYLRRRTPEGAWDGEDDVFILSETPCVAIDLGVADDGTLYLLTDRTGVGDLSWWLARAPAFGEKPQNLRFGSPGEKANALAMHPDRLAVCGTQPTLATDLDIMLRIISFDESGITKGFDYKPPMNVPHQFKETPRDCGFAGYVIVLAGEVTGSFNLDDPNAPNLNRRFFLEYDSSADKEVWTVDSDPNEAKQSGIESLALDDKGRYITGGYTCGYPCNDPQAELRIFEPGGAEAWQMDLPPTVLAPRDLAWSPAGYVVLTSAMKQGPAWASAFFVQAWKPEEYPALWSYDQNVAPTLHMANAIAIGEFGQIYTGGIGAAGYPAVAFING